MTGVPLPGPRHVERSHLGPTPSHEKWSAYANRCAVVCYTAQTAELGNEVQPPQQVRHLLNFPVCLKMFKTKN